MTIPREGQRSVRGAFLEVINAFRAFIVRAIFTVAKRSEISGESNHRLDAVEQSKLLLSLF
jgi:hypothetical protein